MKPFCFSRATKTLGLLALSVLSVGVSGAEAPRRPLLVTVDDLPIGGSLHTDPKERLRITRDLLAVLAKHRVKAVGFVTWRNLLDPSETALLGLWLRGGHELGNHTFSHLDLTKSDVETWTSDVDKGREALASFLKTRGSAVRFFRFPFLREGDTLEKLDAVRAYLARTSQRNVSVTLDTQDWSFDKPWTTARRAGDAGGMKRVAEDYEAALRLAVREQEALGDRLLSRVTPQVLLLHANDVGAARWDALFSWLEKTGHVFASADEVLADAAFQELPRLAVTHGFGLWDRLLMERRLKEARSEVESLLTTQAAAWNSGDLEAFCSVYAEDALFLSPSGLTRGRQAVLDRYRKRYPDAATRGTLSFELLDVRPAIGVEFTPQGDARPGRVHAASLAARWTIAYPEKPAASGLTLLDFERRGGAWLIVHDASM